MPDNLKLTTDEDPREVAGWAVSGRSRQSNPGDGLSWELHTEQRVGFVLPSYCWWLIFVVAHCANELKRLINKTPPISESSENERIGNKPLNLISAGSGGLGQKFNKPWAREYWLSSPPEQNFRMKSVEKAVDNLEDKNESTKQEILRNFKSL